MLVLSELFDVSKARVLQEHNYPHISPEGCWETETGTPLPPVPHAHAAIPITSGGWGWGSIGMHWHSASERARAVTRAINYAGSGSLRRHAEALAALFCCCVYTADS